MTCPVCQGSGWQLLEGEGRTAVVRCSCYRDTLTDKLLDAARIPRRYAHCDLDRFVTYGNEKLEAAAREAKSVAERFPIVSKGLFLLGPPGVGKTHLAVATLRQIIGRTRAHGLFYDTRELLRVIRSTFGSDPMNRLTESDVLRPVIDADVLVLDDLGAEKTSEWVEETLNYVVNARYSERRLTLFTSNYDIAEDATDPDSLQVRVGFRMVLAPPRDVRVPAPLRRRLPRAAATAASTTSRCCGRCASAPPRSTSLSPAVAPRASSGPASTRARPT